MQVFGRCRYALIVPKIRIAKTTLPPFGYLKHRLRYSPVRSTTMNLSIISQIRLVYYTLGLLIIDPKIILTFPVLAAPFDFCRLVS